MIDPLVTKTLSRFEIVKTFRYIYEADWRDIKDLVRPISGEVNPYGPTYVPGLRSTKCLDSTAVDALEELASALHSYLTSPVERWFSLVITDPDVMDDPESLLWLEQTADIIYAEYARPEARFNTAIHEVYLDIGSYGTGIIGQEWIDGHLMFKGHGLPDCWILENNLDTVDTLFRMVRWRLEQIEDEFGFLPPELKRIQENKQARDKLFRVIHGVAPRGTNGVFKKTMPFESVWVCMETKELLRDDGYMSFPYHCPRWTKVAGEIYGRSPAMKCLPDVRMLNAMERTIIKAAEKIVDPPLQVPDDAFLTPIRTSPGAILYKEPNSEHIEPLITQGNIPVGLEYTDRKREMIKRAFYNDWIRMEKEKVEMTAYETADRRDEKLRLIAPMLGRQEVELLGPCIARSIELLSRHNRLPPPPKNIMGRLMRVIYNSQASRAQLGTKAVAMGQFVQELMPMAQIAPDILDIVDTDAYARELAKARGVSRLVLRSDDQLNAIRQKKQQAQAMQQAVQVAEPATKSIKNLADAAEKGGGLVGNNI